MDPLAWPADDVLAELGRITWAAMQLECLTGLTCEAVIGSSEEIIRESVGRQLTATLEVLETWRASDAKTNGERWLHRAQEALKQRHAILHVTVSSNRLFLGPGEPMMDPETLWVKHDPRQGPSHPVMPVTVEALRPTRDALVAAHVGGGSVRTDLKLMRSSRWRAGMVDRSSLAGGKRYVEPTIEEEFGPRRRWY